MSGATKFFIGLIGAGLIGLLGIYLELIPYGSAASAQDRLASRAADALKEAGADWAMVSMEGQKAVISGAAPSDEALEEAKHAVRHALGQGGLVAGGVTVVDATSLRVAGEKPERALAVPFTWTADWPGAGGGAVALSGYVPDEATRAALVAEAEGLFPAGVEDDMLVADGAPAGWRAAALSKLRSLVELDRGRVTAQDRRFNIYGEADQATEFAAARSRLADFPDGFESGFNIEAPQPVAGAAEPDPDPVIKADPVEAIPERPRRPEPDKTPAPEEPAETEVTATPAPEVRPALVTRRGDAAGECQARFDSVLAEDAIDFASARATINRDSKPVLDALAQIARDCADNTIMIAGHTDSAGDAVRNQRLSELRAEAVLGYLASTGVPTAKLKATGFGEDRPVAPNNTVEGRARNRRIEFTVSAP